MSDGVSVPAAPDPTAQLAGWSPAGAKPLPDAHAYWYDTMPQGLLPQHPRLAPSQITHLALEGGGGKGFAFLGAIKALEELKILEHRKDDQGRLRLAGRIQGFAGASAGAITSLLLSCGLDAAAIEQWMTKEVEFAKFFDPASPRQDFQGNPIMETPAEAKGRAEWKRKLKWAIRPMLAAMADMPKVIDDAAHAEPGYVEKKGRKPWDDDSTLTKVATAGFEVVEGIGPLPVTVMAKDLDARLAWLDRDMGIFSGAFAWSTFDQLLRKQCRGADASSGGPVTFSEHHDAFRVALSLTGSNLYTGKTVYFNVKTTPDLPVATAVRASMSLPIIFKPVFIASQDPEINGLYIDGGVWNNTPADAFDTDQSQPSTLVLRLGVDSITEVKGFGGFVGRYLELTAGGSGETQFARSRAFQAIELDTTGLDTVDFTPPEKARKEAVDRAYVKTLDYFRSR